VICLERREDCAIDARISDFCEGLSRFDRAADLEGFFRNCAIDWGINDRKPRIDRAIKARKAGNRRQ